jgi:hypothetical protein
MVAAAIVSIPLTVPEGRPGEETRKSEMVNGSSM